MIEFINESQFEDFYRDERDIVNISTIHKAKGREFDSVYILLQNFIPNTDEKRRVLYVGMTRAKTSLYIHCNDNLNHNPVVGIQSITDSKKYTEPDELLIQLTHQDVYLDYFKFCQGLVEKLRSGDCLTLEGSEFYAQIDGKKSVVARLSKKCKENVNNWASKGYFPQEAKVQFGVAWRKQGEEKDIFIILPILRLKKAGQ